MRSKKNRRQRGAAMVEYSLLLGSIALLAIPSIRAYTHSIKRTFCAVILLKGREQLTNTEYTADDHCFEVGVVDPYF